MPTGTAPIARALVQKLRSDPALKAGLVGDIHEGVAPLGTKQPWLVYSLHFSTYDYDWGGVVQQPGFDVVVFGENQVVVRDLDALIQPLLHDAALDVEGQTTLLCRRTLDISSAEIGADGKKVYMVGGLYEIWTDQRL